MKDIEIFQPWSSFVMKTKLPSNMVKKMIDITDDIISDENSVSHNKNLAAVIENQFSIPYNMVGVDIKDFLNECVIEYISKQHKQNYPFESADLKFHSRINDMWVVSQKD